MSAGWSWLDVAQSAVGTLLGMAPIEVGILTFLYFLWRRVGKLATLQETLPDLTAEERQFIKWWSPKMIHGEMKTQKVLHNGEEPWK